MQYYHILPMNLDRTITLSGNNIYPSPALHPDRIMAEHDLMYITSGNWSVAVEDDLYPDLTAGDVVFMRAGARHRGIFRCSLNARTQFIHVAPHPQDRYVLQSPSAAFRGISSGDLAVFPTVVHCSNMTQMEALFNQMTEVFWGHREDQKRTLNLILDLILNEISHYAYLDSSKEKEWCSTIIEMFMDNPSVTYSVEELADEIGISARTLSSHFSKIMGTSIRQYQINMKLELAYHALCGSGIPVKDIAARFGFCDAYYFSRMFKRKYGFNPNMIKNRDPGENIYRIYKEK